MEFSHHCGLFIFVALARFLILSRYLINVYWIIHFWGNLQNTECPAIPRPQFLVFHFFQCTQCLFTPGVTGIPTFHVPQIILI